MASVAKDPNGYKRVCFTDGDGKRRSIRLGRASVKAAESFALRIEALLTDKELGRAHDAELCAWLLERPDRMYVRLARVGLVEPRAAARTVTLAGLLAAFLESVDVKPATRVRMKQAEAALLDYFTKTRDVATIGELDADAWRANLKEQGYAQATISRTVLYARQIFRWGIKRGMTIVNPFAELKTGPQTNPARQFFVDRASVVKVIDAAPDVEWRLLIALSRFGGLRVPSEALALRWSDVNWEHNRLTVRSPKTEHHEGGGGRILPLFPEIREHLQTVFDQAPEGSAYVIGRYREGANLNPQFHRIVKRAGLAAWPRLWHNLRASRQTELAASYPLHTVCAWIGNTKAIAAGHYLQTTDAHWMRATAPDKSGAQSGALEAQNAAQHPTAPDRDGPQTSSERPRFAGNSQAGANKCELATDLVSGQGRT